MSFANLTNQKVDEDDLKEKKIIINQGLNHMRRKYFSDLRPVLLYIYFLSLQSLKDKNLS